MIGATQIWSNLIPANCRNCDNPCKRKLPLTPQIKRVTPPPILYPNITNSMTLHSAIKNYFDSLTV